MAAFLIPFDASNLFGGLHESLYADHASVSSFLAVTTAAFWSHLWHYPENLACLTDVWNTLYASCLQLIIPFLVPIILWFGLDRFLKQSENAFLAINHLVDFEREKLSSSQCDAELKQCLDLMKKNRQDYQELLRLCDQFPGQREKMDMLRLQKVRTSGSGDLMRLQCLSELSDDTDTDWPTRNKDAPERRTPAEKQNAADKACFGKGVLANPAIESDSDRTFPGYTDDDEEDAERLNEAAWRYDATASRPPMSRTRKTSN